MSGPTLAEMVERLRTCADVAPLPVVADALTEIDRRLTALEVRAHAYPPDLDPKGREIFDAAVSAVEKELADIGPDARALVAYLDRCTAQITPNELAHALDLPADRVREVIRRAGIAHRWLV